MNLTEKWKEYWEGSQIPKSSAATGTAALDGMATASNTAPLGGMLKGITNMPQQITNTPSITGMMPGGWTQQYQLYPQTPPPQVNDTEIISKRIGDIAQLIELYKREFGDDWKEIFKLTANDVMRR